GRGRRGAGGAARRARAAVADGPQVAGVEAAEGAVDLEVGLAVAVGGGRELGLDDAAHGLEGRAGPVAELQRELEVEAAAADVVGQLEVALQLEVGERGGEDALGDLAAALVEVEAEVEGL